MAVGGMIACLLDNIIPGTTEERGIRKWRNLATGRGVITNVASVHVYDLPFGVTNKWKFTKFVPFLPYYDDPIENAEMGETVMGNMTADTDVKAETSQKTNSNYYDHTTVL